MDQLFDTVWLTLCWCVINTSKTNSFLYLKKKNLFTCWSKMKYKFSVSFFNLTVVRNLKSKTSLNQTTDQHITVRQILPHLGLLSNCWICIDTFGRRNYPKFVQSEFILLHFHTAFSELWLFVIVSTWDYYSCLSSMRNNKKAYLLVILDVQNTSVFMVFVCTWWTTRKDF